MPNHRVPGHLLLRLSLAVGCVDGKYLEVVPTFLLAVYIFLRCVTLGIDNLARAQ